MEFILIILAGAIYFLPGLIAWNKNNAAAVWVLNIFLGWTFIGWVVALVWACTSDPEPVQVINNVSHSPPKQHVSKVDEIERLKKLFDDGALTREEYEREKSEVLKR